jgi:hypothetical protein
MKPVKINEIDEMLQKLPPKQLREVRTFVSYLIDKERRRKELVERVLKAEQEPPIRFKTVEDAVKAVFDES